MHFQPLFPLTTSGQMKNLQFMGLFNKEAICEATKTERKVEKTHKLLNCVH